MTEPKYIYTFATEYNGTNTLIELEFIVSKSLVLVCVRNVEMEILKHLVDKWFYTNWFYNDISLNYIRNKKSLPNSRYKIRIYASYENELKIHVYDKSLEKELDNKYIYGATIFREVTTITKDMKPFIHPEENNYILK